MDSESVLKYIQETGFRPINEIKAQFSNENQEVLESVLTFLVSKNKVRKIQFQAPAGASSLYWVVPKE
jgi:hypothetical protein